MSRFGLVLDDPLLNNSGHNFWVAESGSQSPCQLVHGGYQVQALPEEFSHYCIADGTNFENFAYEVKMTLIKGQCGGIVFRADLANEKAYGFTVCLDTQTYCLERFSQDKPSVPLLGCTHDQRLPIKVHNGSVLLAVVANGTNFQLFVQNFPLPSLSWQWFDRTPIGSPFDLSPDELKQGQIGALAGNDFIHLTEKQTVAVFSDAKVWVLRTKEKLNLLQKVYLVTVGV